MLGGGGGGAGYGLANRFRTIQESGGRGRDSKAEKGGQ